MKRQRTSLLIAGAAMAIAGTVLLAYSGNAERTPARSAPVGTGFTYQGQLKRDGVPVTVPDPGCDFTFRLYDDPLTGNQVGAGPSGMLSKGFRRQKTPLLPQTTPFPLIVAAFCGSMMSQGLGNGSSRRMANVSPFDLLTCG